jgi:hypothetical protein
MMAVRESDCSNLGLQLAGVADGSTRLEVPIQQHVSACLRCQAELAAYRKLRRSLLALRELDLGADPARLDELLERVRPDAPVHRLNRQQRAQRRRAFVSAALALGAATGAGLAVALARPLGRARFAA